MALLPWMAGYRFAVAFVAVFALVVNFALLLRYRRHFDKRVAAPLLVGALIGAPLGSAVPTWIDAPLALRLLGVFVTTYAAVRLLTRRRPAGAVRTTRRFDPWGVVCGAAGGVLGAAFNTGGPPAVVYGTARRWSPGVFKATLQAFFLTITALQITAFSATGVLTGETLRANAIVFPVLAAGLWVGARLSDRLDGPTFEVLVLVALCALGIAYIVQ